MPVFNNYDLWKLATPPEYEFMGPEPDEDDEESSEDEEHRLYERLHQIQTLVQILETERDTILMRLGEIADEIPF